LWRPGTRDPVGRSVCRRPAWAAAEGADNVHSQFGRQAYSQVLGSFMQAGNCRVGVNRIAMARKGTDDEAVSSNILFDLLLQGRLGESGFSVQERALGVC